MLIFFGILAGIVGFLPLFVAMRFGRRSTSVEPLTVGLYGLGGACLSLVVLIVLLLLVAVNARDQLLSFAVSEVVVFLAVTITYFVYLIMGAKRRTREQEMEG